jgi:hypothetical protein
LLLCGIHPASYSIGTGKASTGDKLKIAIFGDLSLVEAMDLSRDRQILEPDPGRLQLE